MALAKFPHVPLDQPFVEYCNPKYGALLHFSTIMRQRFLVTQQKSVKGKTMLLFDGRHIKIDCPTNKSPHLFCWHFDDKGRLVHQFFRANLMPKLHYTNYGKKQMSQPLHILIDHTPAHDPQDLVSLQDYLQDRNDVEVLYAYSLKPKSVKTWLTCNVSLKNKITLEAFPLSDYSIAYRLYTLPPKFAQIIHKNETIKNNYEALLKLKNEMTSDPSFLNRRSSVSVHLSGLSLAFRLCLCSWETLLNLSQQLSETMASIWCHFDDKMFLRHITYSDIFENFSIDLKYELILPELNTENSPLALVRQEQWARFFELIFEQQKRLVAKRQAILEPLLYLLAIHKDMKIISPWVKCLRTLHQTIQKQRILVFCSDDTVLHSLKLPLAYFMQ